MDDIRDSTQSFESVATFGVLDATWEHGEQSDEVSALRVTPNLCDALRLRPVMGRLFLPSDATTQDEAVVLISHELWESRFEGSPEVIGQTVRLDKRPRTIVGVLPAGLKFPLERAPTLGGGSILKAGQHEFWPTDVRTARGRPDFTCLENVPGRGAPETWSDSRIGAR
jgi:hypothetical protein